MTSFKEALQWISMWMVLTYLQKMIFQCGLLYPSICMSAETVREYAKKHDNFKVEGEESIVMYLRLVCIRSRDMVYMFTGWLYRALTTLLHCRLLYIGNGLQLMQQLSLKPTFVISTELWNLYIGLPSFSTCSILCRDHYSR